MPSLDSAASEELKKRVRDVSVLFEHKEGSRMIDIKDVEAIVRTLGVNPSGSQLAAVVDQLAAMNAEGDHTSLLQLEHVETAVTHFLLQNEQALARDDYFQLIRAFRAFDPEGKGYADAEMVKMLLTTRGEAMTEEEASRMLSFAADENGRIYYEDYAQKLATDGRTI